MAGEHILIADDDADLVGAMAATLESAGYRVSVASNGQEAWDKASEDKPDLAIVDVMMDTLSEEKGVRITDVHLFLSGYCAECQEGESTPHND